MRDQKDIARQYLTKKLMSSSPEEIVLRLYEGAIGFLSSAVTSLDNGDRMNKAKMLDKAVNIINYLRSCLDMERGGEMSANLNRLYDYMMVTLTKSNVRDDAEGIRDVIETLQIIREGWSGICAGGGDSKWADAEDVECQPQAANGIGVGEREFGGFTAVA